jgi:hypothetical protein
MTSDNPVQVHINSLSPTRPRKSDCASRDFSIPRGEIPRSDSIAKIIQKTLQKILNSFESEGYWCRYWSKLPVPRTESFVFAVAPSRETWTLRNLGCRAKASASSLVIKKPLVKYHSRPQGIRTVDVVQESMQSSLRKKGSPPVRDNVPFVSHLLTAPSISLTRE